MDFEEDKNEKVTIDYLLAQSMSDVFKKNKKKLTSFVILDNQNIAQTLHNMENGYFVYMYQNNSRNKVYYESLFLHDSQSLRVCLPHKENSYEINVRPNCTENVIIRQPYKMWQETEKLGFPAVIGDDNEILQAQREGERRDRTKDKSIYSKELKLDNGYIVVYKNKSETGQVLSETINSAYFDKSEPKEGDNKDKKAVHVDLAAGQNMVVKFVVQYDDQTY